MTKWARAFYFGLCVLGILLSSYAYYVEQKAQSKGYNGSLCDFGAGISCTTVLTSNFSRGMALVGPLLGESHPLNFSNAIYGLLLYCFLIVLVIIPGIEWFLLAFQSVVVVFEVYLMYILFILMKDICPVCTSIMVINYSLWPLAFLIWWKSSSNSRSASAVSKTTKKSQ